MSLFKFHDSNFINGYNKPNVIATEVTQNGNQFKLVGDSATVHATVSEAQAGDIYVMYNIIDKPEILNTEDYNVKVGQYIRAFRLKDFVGQEVDLSADLVTDAFGTVTEGKFLVPRTTIDTTDTMLWKAVTDVTGYEVYLVVTKKTTFGTFTIDANGGTVLGGYVARIASIN